MTVAIVWNGEKWLLEQTMEELVEKNGYYLFTVVCGSKEGMGYQWARKHGLPVWLLEPVNSDHIAAAADYLVAYNDGSKEVRELIMKFSMKGKHGTIIREE